MRWLVRGDVDGFFGLALDNLVQLLVIDLLCRTVLNFPPSLIYSRILPAVAVSLVVGNLYYAWQARALARATGRDDICALPYGINTVSLFAFIFLVMLPARLAAEAAGSADPSLVAWRVGLVACLGSGLIELAGALVAERVRRATPRAALLSTLAGIALTFISLGFLFRTYARPLVGLTTFGIIMMVYFGRVRFRGGLPGGLVAVSVGTAMAWILGYAPVSQVPLGALGLHLPWPAITDLLAGLGDTSWVSYVSVIIPMGLFSIIGSLQNIESAEAAGDSFPTRPSLMVNGMGTIVAAVFGSCFPTTLYIGHPGWKEMGARAGYSVLNAVFFAVVLLTGTLSAIVWAVPIEAGMAIVLWIGVVITAQAFSATPRAHAPAVVIGLLPGVAAWGALMAKNGLRAAGVGSPGGKPFSVDLVARFQQSDTWIEGAFALEQGFILTSLLLAGATVALISREFRQAALWCALASVGSALGFMHSYKWTGVDTVASLAPAWPWAAGYGLMAACFWIAPWIVRALPPGPEDDGGQATLRRASK
jgi:AGZA family xanthine/uracil permease-like MFS transporter